ncbi:hypothetical protein J6590_067013 [Homalodisca vitripennis]|nr:hypothetical protein J6590_067013 [Homalodisca vitripennis]
MLYGERNTFWVGSLEATERSRSTANSIRLFLSVSTWASPTDTTESGHCCATTDQGAAKPAMTRRCI